MQSTTNQHLPKFGRVSPVSPPPPAPKRGGRIVAASARTLPPNEDRVRYPFGGRRLTEGEWASLQALLAKYPEGRLRRGEQEFVGVNRYFLRYHRSSPNGEKWGTKEELAESRRRSSASSVKSQRKRMETDPVFRAERMEKLAHLIARRKVIEEADEEVKAEQRIKAAAIKKKYRAKKKAIDKKNFASAIARHHKGLAVTRLERAAIHRAQVDADRAARRVVHSA